MENLLTFNYNTILCGDFNAHHPNWGCCNISQAGAQLHNLIDNTDLVITAPTTPTRYGHISANTIDIAIIRGFNHPYNIHSLDELSSDHNPVSQTFKIDNLFFPTNNGSTKTNWNKFTETLEKLPLDFPKITNPNQLDNYVKNISSKITQAHQNTTKSINSPQPNYLPPDIKDLIKRRNKARKIYQHTRNPRDKMTFNRLQGKIKRDIIKFKEKSWIEHLNALDIQDNTLWNQAKFF